MIADDLSDAELENRQTAHGNEKSVDHCRSARTVGDGELPTVVSKLPKKAKTNHNSSYGTRATTFTGSCVA